MLRALEDRLAQLPGQKVFLRSAGHMQNWGRVLPVVKATGHLPTFHDPPDAPLPTVSAMDLGTIAAKLMLEQVPSGNGVKIVHAEGPRRYSNEDVAGTLGQIFGHQVDVAVVPREKWTETLEKGMSLSLAELLVRANDAMNKGGLLDAEQDGEIMYGTTELFDVLQEIMSVK